MGSTGVLHLMGRQWANHAGMLTRGLGVYIDLSITTIYNTDMHPSCMIVHSQDSIVLIFNSSVVKVYRRCEANRRWTAVDFSGCVLSSSEQQVLVIISLLANITTHSGDDMDIPILEQKV